jgi:anti-sigma regulatory factor (Ser/Thr protein kinase)
MNEATMHHDLFMYGDDSDFANRTAPFLRTGVESGETVLTVVTDRKWAILREALGDVAQDVEFTSVAELYTRPEDVLSKYDAAVRDYVRAGAPAVRVMGELPPCTTRREWDAWVAYDAILNPAFEGRPVWIMCGYDEREVPDHVLDGALRAHPHTLADAPRPNPRFEEPAKTVRAMTPEPESLPQLRYVQFEDGARGMREQLARELGAAGVPPERARDLISAAGEVLANARNHGGGAGGMRLGLVDGSFVCEISDRGTGMDDPLAGYVPPRPDDEAGGGLWVARQLTSRLELMGAPSGGLTVRLWS